MGQVTSSRPSEERTNFDNLLSQRIIVLDVYWFEADKNWNEYFFYQKIKIRFLILLH